ncbi:MAG: hypothetical protein RLY86_2238 [Pseudomonadota bacterium]|jgi:hypothetical protein
MTFVPLSRALHGRLHLRRFQSYAFARCEAVVPLVAAELPKAATRLPIAFVEQDNLFVLVALTGLSNGQNLFVLPDGKWAGGYVPAYLRGYPFRLARSDDGMILCIDESSGLLAEDGDAGPLFGEDGRPAESVQQVLNFLTQVEANRNSTIMAVAALAKHGLLEPWPLTLAGIDGDQRQIDGLLRIKESSLQLIRGDALGEVQAAGGLAVAYGQLYSMANLASLAELFHLHIKLTAAAPPVPEPTFQLPESDTIDFNW